MASNSALIPVKDRGWLDGFGTLFRKENLQWWASGSWLVQIIIWMAIINGLLAAAVLINPEMKAARQEAAARLQASGEPVTLPVDTVADTALMVFFIFSGMAPAVGVVIIGQEAIIQERQTGTAAWVLSKPVARAAFILSKLSADAIGVLVTMVLVQGLVASQIYRAAVGQALPFTGFLAALGLLYLLLLFYLALTVMLGCFFHSRGPVIGIPLALVFGNQMIGMAPWLANIMPWNLVLELPGKPSLAITLAKNQPLPTVTPIISTVVLTLAFITIALWRFQKEEF